MTNTNIKNKSKKGIINLLNESRKLLQHKDRNF